jgi:hypothetical protein
MFRNIISAILVYLSITHGANGQAPKLIFQDFVSVEGKFTAVMPGEPKKEIQAVDSPAGKMDLHMFKVTLSRGDFVYMVTYNDLPPIVALVDPQIVLKGVRDGILAQKRKLISDGEIVLGEKKIPGRAILIEYQTRYLRARIFMAGTRLYNVTVAGPKIAVTSPDADRFLDSFKITK